MLPPHATPAERTARINSQWISDSIAAIQASGITAPQDIAKALGARGVPPPKARAWTAAAVRRALLTRVKSR
jgi:hypothetical protein